MFATEVVTGKGFEKVVLRDNVSQTFVEILPSCGGILHGFHVLHNGEWINIIDHYEDEPDFRANVTKKGFKSCKLSPFACRIRDARYAFAGKEYTIRKFLLGTSAIHGLLYDVAFTITNQSAGEDHALVSLLYEYRGEDEGYPFEYDCIVHYQLKNDDLLEISTEIINRDKGLIPVQDGWHPYFTFGNKIDGLQLEFQAKQKFEFDEALIPTGALLATDEFNAIQTMDSTSFDNCFVLNFAECQPLCVLRDPVRKIQLEIFPDRSYPYLQVYTPPHRNSIALENLSAPPDAFNNKVALITLAPAEKKMFTTSYKINRLI